MKKQDENEGIEDDGAQFVDKHTDKQLIIAPCCCCESTPTWWRGFFLEILLKIGIKFGRWSPNIIPQTLFLSFEFTVEVRSVLLQLRNSQTWWEKTYLLWHCEFHCDKILNDKFSALMLILFWYLRGYFWTDKALFDLPEGTKNHTLVRFYLCQDLKIWNQSSKVSESQSDWASDHQYCNSSMNEWGLRSFVILSCT